MNESPTKLKNDALLIKLDERRRLHKSESVDVREMVESEYWVKVHVRVEHEGLPAL